MKFEGNGIIWDPAKGKTLHDFNVDPVFETVKEREIKLLRDSGQVWPKQDVVDWPDEMPKTDAPASDEEESPEVETTTEEDGGSLTRIQIMDALKEADIEFKSTMKKEELLSLLNGEE